MSSENYKTIKTQQHYSGVHCWCQILQQIIINKLYPMLYKGTGMQYLNTLLTQIHYLLNQYISLFKMVLILYICFDKRRKTYELLILCMTVHKSKAEWRTMSVSMFNLWNDSKDFSQIWNWLPTVKVVIQF